MAARFDHPAWLTAVGTAISYLLVLLVLFLVVFVLPYLVFASNWT